MPVFGDATSIRFNGNSATKAFLNNNQIWPITSAVVTENLLLHYNTFNTSSYNGSGTTITDISGNGRNGTITGSPTWTSNYFTFVDDYITTPNLGLVITSANQIHSVELWVYPTASGVLIQYNNTSPNTSYHASSIEIVGGNLEVGLWDGSGLSSTGNIGAVSFNQWHQIVLTYNGSVCNGYIDGVFKGSVNTGWSPPLPFYMNFGYADTTSHGDGTNFDGRFGIMRVYNKALTDAEVLSNYNSTLSTIVNLTTNGLVLYYDPSSVSSYPGSGTTITDLSGNGRNGTMSNITYTSPYFTYNGSSSQIAIADNSLLEPGNGDWTMEAWVYLSNTSGGKVILGKFDAGGGAEDVGYSIRVSNANIFSQLGSGTGSGATLFQNSTTHVATTGTWYQLVYVFTNVVTNTFETFVNGASIGSVNHSLASILNTSTNLYIGSYNNGEYSQWMNGRIGITRLYNRALTSTEVLNNYNTDKSKYGL
jgi:hypothetical protein